MNYKKETQFKKTEEKLFNIARSLRMDLKPNKILMRSALDSIDVTSNVAGRQTEIESMPVKSEKVFKKAVIWKAFFGSSISVAVLVAFLLATLNVNFAITDADLFALEAEAYELDGGLDEDLDLSMLEAELDVELGILEAELY